MPSRRQIRAAKDREKKAAQREAEEKKVAANWERLISMPSGFSRTAISGSGVLGAKVFRREVIVNEGRTKQPLPAEAKPLMYEDSRQEEMRIREALAQEEKERKKKRVAVVCHKSSYQYITEGMDPKLFGRK